MRENVGASDQDGNLVKLAIKDISCTYTKKGEESEETGRQCDVVITKRLLFRRLFSVNEKQSEERNC